MLYFKQIPFCLGLNMYAQPIDSTTALVAPEQRKRLTKMVMRLLDEWPLTTAEQLRLLGLRETSRNMLLNYRNLTSILPFEQDKLDRVGLLFKIYQLLYDLFPENEMLRQQWIKRKNQQLDTARPIDLMLENGLFGLAHVVRFLEKQMVI